MIQVDRDPLYPVEVSVQMANSIPNSSLWVVSGAGHGPIISAGWLSLSGPLWPFFTNKPLQSSNLALCDLAREALSECCARKAGKVLITYSREALSRRLIQYRSA